MADFLDAEGNPIPEEQLPAAIQSGDAHVVPGADVHLIDASGRPVTVPSDQVSAALGAGFLPETSQSVDARQTAKEYGSIGQKAITAVEGAGRGVTFGLSDIAASELGGEDYRRAALARKQTNPLTALGGEAAGALAPLLLTGGGSAAATGAKAGMFGRALTAVPRAANAASKALLPFATAETAAGRMALRAAQTGVAGALEGAIYGAGQTAGGIALAGDQITAEKVLSGAGQGALIGGLLGAAGGAIASRLGERSSGAVKTALQEGDDALLRSKLDRLEHNMRRAGASDERVADAVARETERLAARSSKLDQFAGSAAMRDLGIGEAAVRRTGAKASEVDSLLAQAGQDYLSYTMKSGPLAGKRIFHGVRNPVDLLDDISHAHMETRAELDGYLGVADSIAQQAPELAPNYSAIEQRFSSALADLGDAKLAKQLDRRFGETLRELAVPGEFPPSFQNATALRDAMSEELSRLSGKQAGAVRTVRDALDEAVGDAVEQTLSRAGMDPRGFAEAKRMNQSLGLVKEAVEDMKFSQAVGGGGKQVDPSALGYALVGALTGNFAGAVAGGAAAIGKQWLQKRSGGIVAELAHRVARSDIRLGWGAKALAGDAVKTRPAVSMQLTGAKAQQVYSAIQSAASTPESRARYAAEATAPFAQQYPDLAMRVQGQLDGDLQYLAAALPSRESRADSTLTPAAVKSSPGARAAEAKFWEKLRALDDPGSVVDALMEGKLPMAGIEALKDRRPLVYAELRHQVMVETAARSSELPYKRRISLGLAFDFTSDKSLRPGMISSIQQTITSATMPPQQARQPTETMQSAADKSALAMALPSERMEA